MKDEQMQNAIEGGASSDENLDANAYRHVFRALQKEPAMMLPGSFADKVMLKVEAKKSSSVREFVWLGIGIFISIIVLIIALSIAGTKLNLGFLNAMSDYKGLLIFAIISMCAFNFFEKRLLRTREA